MAGRDPERIANSLRLVAEGSLMLTPGDGAGRTISAQMLVIASEEMDRLREYLLETSGRLHQIATENHELCEDDIRELADDMCRMANRREG